MIGGLGRPSASLGKARRDAGVNFRIWYVECRCYNEIISTKVLIDIVYTMNISVTVLVTGEGNSCIDRGIDFRPIAVSFPGLLHLQKFYNQHIFLSVKTVYAVQCWVIPLFILIYAAKNHEAVSRRQSP